MKFIMFLIFNCLVTNIYAKVDYTRHPIYTRIKELKPTLDSKLVMKISNIFHKYSLKHKTNPYISVAIAMQETSLNPNKSRKGSLLVFNEDYTEWKYVRGYSDICMFQFHADTIMNENLNPIKLKLDLEYCIKQHFKLLAKKIKICKKLGIPEKEAWSCYHSYTLKFRKKYLKDVSRYL